LNLQASNADATNALLSYTTDTILSVHFAASLLRLPSIISIVTCTSGGELAAASLFFGLDIATPCIATPCISLVELRTSVAAAGAGVPPAIASFIEARASDTLMPYYPVHRLALAVHFAGEDLSPSARNAHTCHFRTTLIALRVQSYPAGEPFFSLLDRIHKPYQARVRDEQTQATSAGITRGARTLKGRLPTCAAGEDPVVEWAAATQRMVQGMELGTVQPFVEALERAMCECGSSMERFGVEATTLLRRRRMFGADGAVVKDVSRGDAASAPFLALMERVAQHVVEKEGFTVIDVANLDGALLFQSCLLGEATLRDQALRSNLLSGRRVHGREGLRVRVHLATVSIEGEGGHLRVGAPAHEPHQARLHRTSVADQGVPVGAHAAAAGPHQPPHGPRLGHGR